MVRVHVLGAGNGRTVSSGEFQLVHNSWNDWWSYETLYHLTYVDHESARRSIGHVKIASVSMEGKSPSLPAVFTDHPEGVFSLGQDASYYERLYEIGADVARGLLATLGDIAYDAAIRRSVMSLDVTTSSLLRSVPVETMRGQFSRIAKGGTRLTDYSFRFRRRATANKGGLEISINVEPESLPPSNIHVLIGRNGAGKSTLLGDILRAFRDKDKLGAKVASVVSVSFSAFDSFGVEDTTHGPALRPIHYIGLKKPRIDAWDPQDLKSDVDLGGELKESLNTCISGARKDRLIRAIEILENDPIFAESGLSEMLKRADVTVDELANPYWRLSSGHKIVLLTTTRLVETIEEKTLVLLDEPEAHLHPPLLSAFIRALSDLLTNRNGLAIVATHSPVVLQEVPSSCVWKIARSGLETSVARPDMETFGENVGTLTHEIFGLEVRGTGFYRLLTDVALGSSSYQEALGKLDGQLGQEGRAILRAQMYMNHQEV